jgi:group I intron endonuclease
MIGIYKYTNKTNGKIYIGRSIDIARRRWEHFNKPSPYSYFDQTLIKIGEDKFDFEILEECQESELREREKYWIEHYNCCVIDNREGGYNLTHGGEEYRSEENPWARLSMIQVNEIIDKLRHSTLSIQDIADQYGVHRNTISDINRCKTWAWAHEYKGNIRKEAQGGLHHGELNTTAVITEEIAKNIIKDLEQTAPSMAALARLYQVKESLIYDINRCRTWKHLHNYKNNIRNESRKVGDAK